MSSEVALPTAVDTTPSDKGTTIAFVGKDRRHNPPWWKYVQWSIAALFVGGSILFSIAELQWKPYDKLWLNLGFIGFMAAMPGVMLMSCYLHAYIGAFIKWTSEIPNDNWVYKLFYASAPFNLVAMITLYLSVFCPFLRDCLSLIIKLLS